MPRPTGTPIQAFAGIPTAASGSTAARRVQSAHRTLPQHQNRNVQASRTTLRTQGAFAAGSSTLGPTRPFPFEKPQGESIAPGTRCDEILHEEELSQSIAIIGLSLKFPQEASSAEGFWDMLMGKRCAMTEVP